MLFTKFKRYISFNGEECCVIDILDNPRNALTGNRLSDYGKISCGVSQASILGALLFLIYLNNIPQAVKSNLFLYADDSCLMYQHRDVEEIEKQLNKDFENVCDWFFDNILTIHFGEDKTKFILFASKRKIKNA